MVPDPQNPDLIRIRSGSGSDQIRIFEVDNIAELWNAVEEDGYSFLKLMAYPLRISDPDYQFHVMNRGDHRDRVFEDDGDYILFLEIVLRYKRKYQMRFYHYIIMPNHFHFLVEPTSAFSLSKFMHGLTISHTRHYNHKHKTTGHVWQGRYKAVLIKGDEQFLQCAKYIELNPVRAGIVDHPSKYRWSSYHARAEGRDDPLLDNHPLHESFLTKKAKKRQSYRRFIEEDMRFLF